MQRDESSINSDIKGPKQLQQLDRVFAQVIEALEKSRENIFEINQDCENHCLRLETEIQGINKQIQQVIETVDKLQILERQARIRLMEVSRRFDTMTETDIKKAYEKRPGYADQAAGGTTGGTIPTVAPTGVRESFASTAGSIKKRIVCCTMLRWP